jgi:hypothetical protein
MHHPVDSRRARIRFFAIPGAGTHYVAVTRRPVAPGDPDTVLVEDKWLCTTASWDDDPEDWTAQRLSLQPYDGRRVQLTGDFTRKQRYSEWTGDILWLYGATVQEVAPGHELRSDDDI